MAPTDHLDEEALHDLVTAFYARVRADDLIGPLFETAIDDWNHHLARLTDFWSSVMLSSGAYKGQPVPAHLRHRGAMTPTMFDRWLSLWRQTTADMFAADMAAALQAKADRIAESLKLALYFTVAGPQSDAASA